MRIDTEEAFKYFRNRWNLQLAEGLGDGDIELLALLQDLSQQELLIPVEWKVCELESDDPTKHVMEILFCVGPRGLRKLFEIEDYFARNFPFQEGFELRQVNRIRAFCGKPDPKLWTGWMVRKQFEDHVHGPEDVRKLIRRLMLAYRSS